MTMKFVYDKRRLTNLESNSGNIPLTHAAWRAAVSAGGGGALHRPTKRGCRGGANKQRKITNIVGNRPELRF